jgi:hypothetical protein
MKLEEIINRRDEIQTAITKNKMYFAKKLYISTQHYSKNELANILNKDLETIDLYLSGTYDFSLEEITVLEKFLNIELLNLK